MGERTKMRLAALALGATLAYASPGHAATSLACQVVNSATFTWDGLVTVDLDEAAGLVTVRWPGYAAKCFQGACPAHQGGWTAGPSSARFSADEITFSASDDRGFAESYTLNRLTGEMGVTNPRFGGQARRLQCAVAKRQF